MRRLIVAALMTAAMAASSRASAQIVAGPDSQTVCRYYAKDDETLYRLCMFHEYQAANTLNRIAAAVPRSIVYACNRKSKDQNSLRWMLDCFNAELDDLPESGLPSGSATLYSSGVGRRFWTLEDCQRSRQDGEVCSIH